MSEPRSEDEAPVLRVVRPGFAARLSAGHRPGAAQRAPAAGRAPAAATPPHTALGGPPVSVVKRIERYVSAIFKLGRTARSAKAAAHSVSVIEPRVDALLHDHHELGARVDDLGARVDDLGARVDGLEAEAGGAADERLTRLEDAAARTAPLAPRLEQMEGRLEGIDGRLDTADGWLQTAEARLDSFEVSMPKIGAAEKRLDLAERSLATLRSEAEALRADRDRLRVEVDALTERAQTWEGYFKALEEDYRAFKARTEGRLGALEAGGGLEEMQTRLDTSEARLDRAAGDIAQTGRAYSDLSRRLDLLRFGASAGGVDRPPTEPVRREGLDALMDAFYGRLEDRYRGSREEIKERLRVYLPDIARAAEAAPERPVLDLGCGRGEWVELLTDEGHLATGIDLNAVQIAEAEAAGLDVRQGDALETLAEAPDRAYAAITAHHLIEHLPFETLTWMTREALRVLAPGGVLIYETPNCQNLIVGASTFHIDPTHMRPLPPQLLSTLLDTLGFHPVELRPLHPSGTLEPFLRDHRADPYLAELLFGPQDLAVIAQKPRRG